MARRPIRYKKDFLDKVLARVDFTSPVGMGRSGPPRDVVDVIKKWFPVGEQAKLTTTNLLIAEKAVTEEGRKETTQWRFYSKDRLKHIELDDNSLLLQYDRGKYRNFRGFRNEFVDMTNALCDAFEHLQVNRLGLRYIDRIELNDEANATTWGRYINRRLLAPFDLADNRATLSRVMQWIEFNYDDVSLRLQCGMPNPDYPARIRQKIFVLDFDAYCSVLLSRTEVAECLDKLHERTKDAFEEAILEPLRKRMGAEYA